jgi:hypothetical protein
MQLAKARTDIALNAAIVEMVPVACGDGIGQRYAISHQLFSNAQLPL